MVGGGVNRFIVTYLGGGERPEWWSVVDHSKDDACELLIVGGQEGEYPSKLLVDLDTAERVALHFLEYGEMYPGVEWECQ